MSTTPEKIAQPTEDRRWQSCPVCEAAEAAPWVDFEQVAFVRCRVCGVVYKQRETTAIREEDFYERGYFEGRASGRERKWERRVRKAQRQLLMAQSFSEAGGLLDIGCSLGYGIEAGHRLDLPAAGTDISQYAIDVCRERGYRAEVAGLEQLPFTDAEFGIVSMRHVLEHTPDPRQAMHEVARVLSPGGVVVIAVPNLDYWKGHWQRRGYRYFRPDDLGRQHYVYYTVASLSRLLDATGFEVVARSKAVFRRRLAGRGALRALYEGVRFAALLAWQAVAAATRMRREIVLIGRRRPP